MRQHEAVKRYFEKNKKSVQVIQRIANWNGNLSLKENAKKLFDGVYQNAFQFSQKFGLSFRKGKKGRKSLNVKTEKAVKTEEAVTV